MLSWDKKSSWLVCHISKHVSLPSLFPFSSIPDTKILSKHWVLFEPPNSCILFNFLSVAAISWGSLGHKSPFVSPLFSSSFSPASFPSSSSSSLSVSLYLSLSLHNGLKMVSRVSVCIKASCLMWPLKFHGFTSAIFCLSSESCKLPRFKAIGLMLSPGADSRNQSRECFKVTI